MQCAPTSRMPAAPGGAASPRGNIASRLRQRMVPFSPGRVDRCLPQDDRPLRDMLHSWLLYIMVPAGLLAWSTTRRPSVALAAAFATPCLAIVQGSLGILSFRLHFGDAPLPCTPSHGVVVVRPEEDSEQEQPPGEGNDDSGTKVISRIQSALSLEQALQQPPVRLLVIGDSLAIGVGQSKSSTPVMPEVIAKTLSKKLNGRVVYWTCHGAPGASTGWIVRELERGVQKEDGDGHDEDDESDHEDLCEHDVGVDTTDMIPSRSSSTSETDDSSYSDESSNSGSKSKERLARHLLKGAGVVCPKAERKQWKERLSQHSKRFYDPNRLGPYDVVVILTGSNDLKSAFFPFLLTGEDAEFRRQAKQRGGSYGLELRRLLETLEQKMTLQFMNFRDTVIHSVEMATERIQESIEGTMERFAPGRTNRTNGFQISKGNDNKKAMHSDNNFISSIHNNGTRRPEDEGLSKSPSRSMNGRPFPVIVLPGMPSRTLPIFRQVPLRWLSVPIVDIMDSHKRKLARSHPDDLLFVKAPEIEDLADYEAGKGTIWEDRTTENILLSLTDIRKRERRLIEAQMHDYFQKRGESAAEAIAKSNAMPWRRWLPKTKIPEGYGVFSVDQIHPNENGYDFWGRYIANAIVDELQRKSKDD